MTTYYVATLARYVLVDAATDAEARSLGPLRCTTCMRTCASGSVAKCRSTSVLSARPPLKKSSFGDGIMTCSRGRPGDDEDPVPW